MAKDKESQKRKGKPKKSTQELVPVIYARTTTEAEFYKGLLTSNDIPAVIEDEAPDPAAAASAGAGAAGMPSSIVGQGVAVLVPDELLDEASEIIAEHEDGKEDEELDEYEDLDDEADDLDEELDDDDLDDDDLDDDLDDEDELDDVDDLDEGEGDEIEDVDEEEDRP